jgi:hypothetical protein
VIDARLVAALRRQLAARRGGRVGWKLGVGDAERIGDTLSVGHLTTTTLLEDGAAYDTAGAELHADAEIAVVVGVGYAPALELVDLHNAGAGAETVVATNIFHRAVAFGHTADGLPSQGALLLNGVVQASESVPDVGERIRSAQQVLAAVGERFEPGDRVITGSVVQVPVQPGDEVTADFGSLGQVSLRIA